MVVDWFLDKGIVDFPVSGGTEIEFRQSITRKGYHLIRTFNTTHPLILPSGEQESEEQVLERLNVAEAARLRESRRNRRRNSRFERRSKIVAGELAKATNGDAEGWKWVANLLNALGSEGMSSDESDKEPSAGAFLRAKTLPWRRRAITDYMAAIDRLRYSSEEFSNKGTKPQVRIREPPKGSIRILRRLPRPLYNQEWLNKQSPKVQRVLEVDETNFEWKDIMMVRFLGNN